jgi:hypothetical protein
LKKPEARDQTFESHASALVLDDMCFVADDAPDARQNRGAVAKQRIEALRRRHENFLHRFVVTNAFRVSDAAHETQDTYVWWHVLCKRFRNLPSQSDVWRDIHAKSTAARKSVHQQELAEQRLPSACRQSDDGISIATEKITFDQRAVLRRQE